MAHRFNSLEDALLATARSQAYHLLAATLMPPTDEHLGHLATELSTEWPKVLDHIGDDGTYAALVDDVARELHRAVDLHAEYDRLFETHAGLAVPPFETEFTKLTPQHAMMQGAQLADISGFYKAFGLRIADSDPERCDHIVTELEFMHFLAFKEAVAAHDGEAEHHDIVRRGERNFMEDHLSRWPEAFRERLEGADAPPYFVAAAKLIEAWVSDDRGYLLEAVPEADTRFPGSS